MADSHKPDGSKTRRAERLSQVIDDCIRKRVTGKPVSDDAVVAEHPELMPELLQELKKLHTIELAVGQPKGESNTTNQQSSSDKPSVRQLTTRCPHCHVPISVQSDMELGDISCSVCGNHFSLVADDVPTLQGTAITKVGHFELIERLGVGGFGTVWKARDTKLERTVAVKIPRKGNLDAVDIEQFFREARTAAQLQHPNIAGVYEVGRDGDNIYIVAEFIRGAPLSEWRLEKPTTCDAAAELTAKIARALHHAHQMGVVHRDLKAANVMIDADNEPHILDFGLAKRETADVTMTLDGQVLGTPAYMPPEQARGEAHTSDPTADIYSLGVIFFELLTGELPFRGSIRMLIHQVLNDDPPRPATLNSLVPHDLETVCLKCLRKEPNKRYDSALALAEDLDRYSAGIPILARRSSPLEHVTRWCQRHPGAAMLAFALVASLTCGIAATSALWLRAADLSRREAKSRADAEQREENVLTALRDLKEFEYLTSQSPNGALYAEDNILDLPYRVTGTAEISKRLAAEIAKLEQRSEEFTNVRTFRMGLAAKYNQLGIVLYTLGNYQDASRNLQAGIAIRKHLVDAHPDISLFQFELATSYFNLGQTLYTNGKYAESELAFDDAVLIRRALLADDPDAKLNRICAAQTFMGRAAARAQGKPIQAENDFSTAHSLWEDLRRDFPSEMHCLAKCRESHTSYAKALDEAYRHDAAEAAHRTAIAYSDQLTKHNSYLDTASGGYLEFALHYRGRQMITEARNALGVAIELCERCVEKHPDLASKRNFLAMQCELQAKLLDLQGSHDDASMHRTQAIEQRLWLIERERGDLDFVVPSLREFVFLLRQSNESQTLPFEDYRSKLQRCLKYIESLSPDDSQVLTAKSKCHQLIAMVNERLGKQLEALASYHLGIDALTRLVGQSPDAQWAINEMAWRYEDAARLQDELQRLADALQSCEQAIELRCQLGPREPNNFEFLLPLANRVNTLANRIQANGRVQIAPRALSSIQKCLEHLESLQREPAVLTALTRCHSANASIYEALGQPTQALTSYRLAIALHWESADDTVPNPQNLAPLASLLTGRARKHPQTGEEQAWMSEIEKCLSRLTRCPDNETVAWGRGMCHKGMAILFARMGQTKNELSSNLLAIDTWSDLSEMVPNSTWYAVELALAYDQAGQGYETVDKAADAEDCYRKSLGIWALVIPRAEQVLWYQDYSDSVRRKLETLCDQTNKPCYLSEIETGHLNLVDATWSIDFYQWTEGATILDGDQWLRTLDIGPVHESTAERIVFDWDRRAPAQGLGAERFAVVATANVELDGGNYEFVSFADDGVRVLLDGRTIIENWNTHPITKDFARVALDGGEHNIRVEYFQAVADAHLEVAFGRVSEPSSPQPQE